MSLQRITSLLLLSFMGLFGVLETTVAALTPRLGIEPGVEICPPEMTMCPMHTGEACCCGMTGESEPGTVPVAQFGEGCLGAPAAPPVVYPITPLFRYLVPETIALDRPLKAASAPLSDRGHALPAFNEPLTPPPQSP